MKAFIIGSMIFTSSLGCGCAIGNKMVANANIYTEIASVYKEDKNNVTFITKDGNLWEMSDYYADKNRKYELTFDMNGTYDITDDTIINIKEN